MRPVEFIIVIGVSVIILIVAGLGILMVGGRKSKSESIDL